MMDFFPPDSLEDDLRSLPLGFMSPTLQSLVSSPLATSGLKSPPPPLSLTPSAYSLATGSLPSSVQKDAAKELMQQEKSMFVNFNDNHSLDEDGPFGIALNSMSSSISPMVSPMKDPFSTSASHRPTLNISADFGSSASAAASMSVDRSDESIDSSDEWSANHSYKESPTPRHHQHHHHHHHHQQQHSGHGYAAAPTLPSLKPPPAPYDQIGFAVTTYRWKPIEDCVHGVPVVEIRPYNKSDGKRYVYVKVDGIEAVSRMCRERDLPVPKARFRVEKCSDGSVLGELAIRELNERGEEVDSKADHEHNMHGHHSDYVAPTSFAALNHNMIIAEDMIPEPVDLSPNLTLLVSERIVRQLDNEGIGKGSPPPEEHQLRVVVSLVFEHDSRAQFNETSFETAVLPFYRIKRRQKRRSSRGIAHSDDKELKRHRSSTSSKKLGRPNSASADVQMLPRMDSSDMMNLSHSSLLRDLSLDPLAPSTMFP